MCVYTRVFLFLYSCFVFSPFGRSKANDSVWSRFWSRKLSSWTPHNRPSHSPFVDSNNLTREESLVDRSLFASAIHLNVLDFILLLPATIFFFRVTFVTFSVSRESLNSLTRPGISPRCQSPCLFHSVRNFEEEEEEKEISRQK